MPRPISKCVDDFPDFILDGFLDMKHSLDRWPRVLLIGDLLAKIMNVRPGVWLPDYRTPGIWQWETWLDPDLHDDLDEFGESCIHPG